MKETFAHIVLSACLSTCLDMVSYGQGGKREDLPSRPEASNSGPIKTSRTGSRKRPGRNQPVNEALASLTVIVNPADSALLLNDQQVEGPSVKGLKPGPYILLVRHDGYRDGLRAIVLVPGENPAINMTLEAIRGTLNVTPSVDGAVINIEGVGLTSDDDKRRHLGAIENLQLAPGDYEMTVSREGYKSVTRKFRIEAAATVFLEPQLQLALSIDPPTVQRPGFSPDRAMAIEASDDGKFVLVTLTGRSGQTDSSGLLAVTINSGAQSASGSGLTGMLTGFPCRVEFRALDNISAGSIVETPGPANQWRKISVRLRVKDSRLPLRFGINWTALDSERVTLPPPTQQVAAPASPGPAKVFQPALVRKKVSPAYGGAARTANLTGLVIVSVQIDDEGNVKSAKATEGPGLLRQAAENAARQWKFNPARRDGKAVQDTQQIRFIFQRE
jgi:TonB family protein